MNKNRQQFLTLRDALACLIISLLVIIITFPKNDWSFGPGLDVPLLWVFNTLFETGLTAGKHIIFPHGPLSFFMAPAQQTVILVTIVTSLLKIIIVSTIFLLFAKASNLTKWLLAFLFTYLISIIHGFAYVLLTATILLYCSYMLTGKKWLKILAFFLTAFAFFIKASVAIISGTLFLPFVLYYFYRTKRIKDLLVDSLTLLGFVMLFWICMYGTLHGFAGYIYGIMHLVEDNSSAAAYYPYNNWLLLTLFFILLGTTFLINRTKKAVFFVILVSLSLFATWKHGMAREDFNHINGFFVYTIICLLILLMFNKKNTYYTALVAFTAMCLFFFNMKNSVGYSSPHYDLFRINNFIEFMTEFDDIEQEVIERTQRDIAIRKLPSALCNAISNSTVDVYPWDYSVIPANGFNWQPRVVIHSYAAYTTWLDKKNADHFSSLQAPDYLVWTLDTYAGVINGNTLNSIDNRYLLNDEPQTIVQFLSNYDYYYSDVNVHVIKKRLHPLPILKKILLHTNATWDEWLTVPAINDGLLRAKLAFGKSLLQRIKSFFYKDEQFWVYLKLKNGLIHKYRIVPKNATDGLWINPYIFNANELYDVDKILFKSSSTNMLTDELVVDWEHIEFKDYPQRVEHFFNIKKTMPDSVIFSITNTFEQPLMIHQNNATDQQQFSNTALSGLKSYAVTPNSRIPVFSVPLDSIPFQKLQLTADCWITAPNYNLTRAISFVLSVDDANGNIITQSKFIDEQLIDEKQWNNVFNSIDYDHHKTKCTLNMYVLNASDEEILIDDLRVLILKSKKP